MVCAQEHRQPANKLHDVNPYGHDRKLPN
jgi:hypothetical protein